MQTLQELTYIVTKNKLSAIELLGVTPKQKPTKADAFYEAILANQFEDDNAAASHFYESDAKNPSYQKLKRGLKKRLINSLFFIDINKPSYTERQKAYYQCYKEWAAVKILLGKNARLSGIEIALNLIKRAKKFEFTELVMDIARILRLHYGTREGDLKRYEQYNELFKQYEQIWLEENRVEELYSELTIRFVNNKATKKALNKKALEYYAQVEPVMQKSDSYRIHLCGNLIRLMIYTTVNDYKNTIELCQEAIAFFEAKPYYASVPLQIWYYQIMVCCIQLRDYPLGQQAADKCLSMIEEGAFNWFKFKELNLMLAMHTKQYQKAYEIFGEVIHHGRFRFLPAAIKETWKIFSAYIHYLIYLNKINPAEGDEYFNKFRLGRFLNEVPIFSKDKKGMNIPVLIIQILFMILQKKYDTAIDRIESIEKYCSRYLKKGDTYRSNCLIKLLLLIPQCSFHKTAVMRKSKKYLKKLQEVPLEVANQTHEIEIIPFEDLWEMGLSTLENSFATLRSRDRSSVA